jgi:hypothetical protein
MQPIRTTRAVPAYMPAIIGRAAVGKLCGPGMSEPVSQRPRTTKLDHAGVVVAISAPLTPDAVVQMQVCTACR